MIPIGAIIDEAKSMLEENIRKIGGLGAIIGNKSFDYTQEGLTKEQMVQGASAIAKEKGAIAGPLGSMIAEMIGAKKAANIADQIIGSREKKMDDMLQMARDKQKEMSIFKRNDINQINDEQWAV